MEFNLLLEVFILIGRHVRAVPASSIRGRRRSSENGVFGGLSGVKTGIDRGRCERGGLLMSRIWSFHTAMDWRGKELSNQESLLKQSFPFPN